MKTLTVDEFRRLHPTHPLNRKAKGKDPKAAAVPWEHWEQATFFVWCQEQVTHPFRRLPECADFYAVPNGGHRSKWVARDLQAEGVKPGVPDIENPHSRRGFTGIHMETKRVKDGTIRPNQKDWLSRLRAAGRCVVVCKGHEALEAVTLWYFGRTEWPWPDVPEPKPPKGKIDE